MKTKIERTYELGTTFSYKGEELKIGAKSLVRGKWRYHLVRDLSDLKSVMTVTENRLEKMISSGCFRYRVWLGENLASKVLCDTLDEAKETMDELGGWAIEWVCENEKVKNSPLTVR